MKEIQPNPLVEFVADLFQRTWKKQIIDLKKKGFLPTSEIVEEDIVIFDYDKLFSEKGVKLEKNNLLHTDIEGN